MGSMKLVSPELTIYTTGYMSFHLASEDLFMVGSLKTPVTVCTTAAQERKSISAAMKVLQNTPV